MRIIFAGTPSFAAAYLTALLEDRQHDIVAVYTQPDRRSGRGKKIVFSAVKTIAENAGLAIEQPVSLKDNEAQRQLQTYDADLMVVAAYGLLLPQCVLDTPRKGCINVHASLLPRWRGAAPIERAIIAGDQETGITIMRMELGLDTGDMLAKKHCSIFPDDTGETLHNRLIEIGKPLLLSTLSLIDTGKVESSMQDDSKSTYAKKLNKEEALIDWHKNVSQLDREIRAFSSSIGSHSFYQGQRIRITHASIKLFTEDREISANIQNSENGTIISIEKTGIIVKCNSGLLKIEQLQIPGSKSMSVAALLNGKPDFFVAGDCLDDKQPNIGG